LLIVGTITGVIAGLDPAIHENVPRMPFLRVSSRRHLMDARVKPAHDGGVKFEN